jgi:iron complex outermembrane receptor protein/hemoglobin/transferrin/lactoferrin receptor protein
VRFGRQAAGDVSRPRERRRKLAVWLCALGAACAIGARAAGRAQDAAAPADDDGSTGELGAAARVPVPADDDDRARSVVTRARLDERLPRSTPDALRYEPGVSIQQTAHGQASPYVRGMTGQQVMHLFDGVRMNNGIFRQGPNQYFFTVDTHTLDRLEVVRGSASTLYGSDALGGAILAFPREPSFGESSDAFEFHPSLYGRFASADLERGGRAELELVLRDQTTLLVGGGYRETERLESGGVVGNPGRRAPAVPRFEADGRTQLGTGFREATFDARVVQRVLRKLRLVGAVYGFRELDAPRTDQCPPPEAPVSECLEVEEQFRTLAYVALRGDVASAIANLDLNVSYQRHDELRVNARPRSFVRTEYDNDVWTLGAALRASTEPVALAGGGHYRVRYGAEAYRDAVESSAVQELTDPALRAAFEPDELRFADSRGQYLDGSVYVNTGLFAELELAPVEPLTLHAGGRVAAVGANIPQDPASGSSAVTPRWAAAVARAGAAASLHPDLTLRLNFDQGFRAPNLDDLSSRQQVGPGFQFENAALEPERTNTLEFGVQTLPGPLSLELWAFATWLDDAITRVVREQSDCPPMTDACRASRTQFQLINAGGTAVILGAEAAATATLPAGLTLRASYAYERGEGDGLDRERVPLSRIPPMGGSVEARYQPADTGLYVAAVLRWTLAQRRLAPSDLADARIPRGGTPGYAICDLRAGFRYNPRVRLNLVLENLLDAAYRVHGSSINGPGRGILLGVTLGY